MAESASESLSSMKAKTYPLNLATWRPLVTLGRIISNDEGSQLRPSWTVTSMCKMEPASIGNTSFPLPTTPPQSPLLISSGQRLPLVYSST